MTNLMRTAGSVTTWLRSLEEGGEDAAHRLWERYSEEMHQVARRRLRRRKRRDIVDEEDIVLSAFASLCLAARKGLLTNVVNRDELWGLMVVATNRKVGQREQYTYAEKRRSGLMLDQAQQGDEFGSRLEHIAADGPCPASAMQLEEQAELMLAKLIDPELRAIAILRLNGHNDDEIAVELGFTRRTIQRKLSLIRSYWDENAKNSCHSNVANLNPPE